MIPNICVSLKSVNIMETSLLAKKAEEMGASLIEFRLDYLDSFNEIKKLGNCVKIPKIATIRRQADGGVFKGTESERKDIISYLSTLEFDYLDIESSTSHLKELVNSIRKEERGIIISYHNFSRTPRITQLERILKRQTKYKADIYKIVTQANNWKDNLIIFNFLHKKSSKVKVISFAMGEYGIPSRIFSPLFGGYFTYTSLYDNTQTAPGQISIKKLKEIYLGVSLDKVE